MTGPAQAPPWRAGIDGLLEALRRREFRIGVDTTLRVHDLLLRLATLGPLPSDPRSLRTYLGPVLVRRREQQPAFDELFHRWAAPYAQGPAVSSAESGPVASARRRQDRSRRALATLVLGVLSALLVQWGGPRVAQWSVSDLALDGSEGTLWSDMLRGLNTTFVLALLGVPLLALFGWACFMVTRRLAIFARNVPVPTATEPVRVGAAGDDRSRARALAEHMRVFARRRTRPSTDLDIEATLRATVRAAGLPTPRCGLRRVLPEYLVLIERRSEPDHLHRLGIELIDAMRHEGVFFNAYTFRETPHFRSLASDQAQATAPASLAELSVRHADHSVILVSDGSPLNSPRSGRAHDWVSGFDAWPEKFLFTPVPSPLWDRAETNLAELGIMPVHFTETSLSLMADALKESRVITPSDLALGQLAATPPLPRSLVTDARRWTEELRPPAPRVEQLVRELRAYLDAGGFRWLCACAAFPRLVPSLTSRIGATLKADDGAPLADEARLLQFVRLPWFRDGRMPQWLRLRLLAELDSRALDTITEEIHRLLAPSAGEGSGDAIHLAGTDGARNEDVTELQPDRLFVDFATTRLAGAGAFPAPATWYRYLNRSALRRTAAAAASLAIGLVAIIALGLQFETITSISHQGSRYARALAVPATIAAVLMAQFGLVDWLVRAVRRDSDRGLVNLRLRLGIWRPLGLHLFSAVVLAVDVGIMALLRLSITWNNNAAATRQTSYDAPEAVSGITDPQLFLALAVAVLGLGLALAFQLIARPILAVRPPLESGIRSRPPLLDALIRHPRPWALLTTILLGMIGFNLIRPLMDLLLGMEDGLSEAVQSVSWLLFWPGLAAVVIAALHRRLGVGRREIVYAFGATLWLTVATIVTIDVIFQVLSVPPWMHQLTQALSAFWLYAALAFTGERLRVVPLRDGLMLAIASAAGAGLNAVAHAFSEAELLSSLSALFYDLPEAAAFVWLLRRYLGTSPRRLTGFFGTVAMLSLLVDCGIPALLTSLEMDFQPQQFLSALSYPLFLALCGAALYVVVLRPERKTLRTVPASARRQPDLDRPSGFGQRAFAGLVDALLVLLLYVMAVLGIDADDGIRNGVISVVILATVTLFYHVVFESSALAGTPGKILTGSMVRREDGSRLSPWRSAYRLLCKTVSVTLLGVGFLPAAFGHRRTLHDYLASTRLVQRRDDA